MIRCFVVVFCGAMIMKVNHGRPLSWISWKGISLPAKAFEVVEEHIVKLSGSSARFSSINMAKSFIFASGPSMAVPARRLPMPVSMVGIIEAREPGMNISPIQKECIVNTWRKNTFGSVVGQLQTTVTEWNQNSPMSAFWAQIWTFRAPGRNKRPDMMR